MYTGDAREHTENQNPGKSCEYALSSNAFFSFNNAQVAKSGNFSVLVCFNIFCISRRPQESRQHFKKHKEGHLDSSVG